MNDLINISVGDAAMTALLGYVVVFFGIIILMIRCDVRASLWCSRAQSAKAAAGPAAEPAAPAAPAAAPGCRRTEAV